jgi:hypothetical protein
MRKRGMIEFASHRPQRKQPVWVMYNLGKDCAALQRVLDTVRGFTFFAGN